MEATPEVAGDQALALPVRALPQHPCQGIEGHFKRHILAQRVQHVPRVQIRSCPPLIPSMLFGRLSSYGAP